MIRDLFKASKNCILSTIWSIFGHISIRLKIDLSRMSLIYLIKDVILCTLWFHLENMCKKNKSLFKKKKKSTDQEPTVLEI